MKPLKLKFWSRLGLIVKKTKSKPLQESATTVTDSVLVDSRRENPILGLFLSALTEQKAIQWLLVAAITVWLSVVIIFACVFTLNTRQVQMGSSANTLREDVESKIKEVSVKRDHFDLFVVTTLQLLFNVDDSGASYRALLKGSVNPEILRRFDAETRSTLAEIRAKMLVQNLTINTIRDFTYNEETGVVSAYVMGYVATIIQQTEKGKRSGTIPFRAKVYVKNGIKNNLSPLGFYLEILDDRLGQDALQWDMEASK